MRRSVQKLRRRNAISRRIFLVSLGQIAVSLLIFIRMYSKQVISSEDYQFSEAGGSIRVDLVTPRRGQILDRNGDVLAYNDYYYNVLLSYNRDPDGFAHQLNYLANLKTFSKEQLDSFHEQVQNPYGQQKALLFESLNQKEVIALDNHRIHLPNLEVQEVALRHYEEPYAFAHIVGYMNRVNKEDLLTDKDPLIRREKLLYVGRTGVERISERRLRGRAGISKYEQDVRGRLVRELDSYQAPVRGEDIYLTLHSELQVFAYNLLSKVARAGSIVVMDVQEGDILACVSLPSFDSNLFQQGVRDPVLWEELNDPLYTPQVNRAVSSLYSPASTFKMLVAIAAFEAGISPSRKVMCRGSLQVGTQRFHCWQRRGHGEMDYLNSLMHSCDIWYYEVSQEVGIDAIARVARRFGLGQALSADYRFGLASGLMPDRSWKKKARRQDWLVGDTVNASIGQGFVSTTSLQLTIMMSTLVNGGKLILPRFYKDTLLEVYDELDFYAPWESIIKDSMNSVVQGSRGTARVARLKDVPFKMGGKTGTSQVTSLPPDGEKLDADDIEWAKRDHAIFCAYAPMDKPRYACTAMIEHGGSGAATAAPLAKAVFEKMYALGLMGRV